MTLFALGTVVASLEWDAPLTHQLLKCKYCISPIRIEKPLLSLYLYNEILSASPVGVTRDNI